MEYKPVNMQRQHDLYQINKFYRNSAYLWEQGMGRVPFPQAPRGLKRRLPMQCPPAYTSYHQLIRYFGRACEEPRCHDVRCYPVVSLSPQPGRRGKPDWPKDLH